MGCIHSRDWSFGNGFRWTTSSYKVKETVGALILAGIGRLV